MGVEGRGRREWKEGGRGEGRGLIVVQNTQVPPPSLPPLHQAGTGFINMDDDLEGDASDSDDFARILKPDGEVVAGVLACVRGLSAHSPLRQG